MLKAAESVQSSCGKWEVTPRKYYDTLNVVVVLKSRSGFDTLPIFSLSVKKYDTRQKPLISK